MSRSRKYSGSISVDVDIEVHEVLDQIGDDDLLAEVDRRELDVSAPNGNAWRALRIAVEEGRSLEEIREAFDCVERAAAGEGQMDAARAMAQVKAGEHPFLKPSAKH